MNGPTESHEERLSAVFHALGDVSRRRILQMLRQSGELRVGDIAQTFDMSLNAVSKHLKTLEKAGLVARRVRGREHWIFPTKIALNEALRYLRVAEQFWHDRLVALERVSFTEAEPFASDSTSSKTNKEKKEQDDD